MRLSKARARVGSWIACCERPCAGAASHNPKTSPSTRADAQSRTPDALLTQPDERPIHGATRRPAYLSVLA
eukprot:5431468-Alexandrium_andersonii.AAC.1